MKMRTMRTMIRWNKLEEGSSICTDQWYATYWSRITFTRLSSVSWISGIYTLQAVTVITIRRSIHHYPLDKPFIVLISRSRPSCKMQHFPLERPLIDSVWSPLSLWPALTDTDSCSCFSPINIKKDKHWSHSTHQTNGDQYDTIDSLPIALRSPSPCPAWGLQLPHQTVWHSLPQIIHERAWIPKWNRPQSHQFHHRLSRGRQACHIAANIWALWANVWRRPWHEYMDQHHVCSSPGKYTFAGRWGH